jgi:hypothetical protein
VDIALCLSIVPLRVSAKSSVIFLEEQDSLGIFLPWSGFEVLPSRGRRKRRKAAEEVGSSSGLLWAGSSRRWDESGWAASQTSQILQWAWIPIDREECLFMHQNVSQYPITLLQNQF